VKKCSKWGDEQFTRARELLNYELFARRKQMGLFDWLFGRKQDDGPRLEPALPQESEVNKRTETLIKIKNEAIAEETNRRDLSRFGLTPEVQKAVQDLLAESARKGENPRHCKVKNILPDDFVWQEYDEWLEKFKTTKKTWRTFGKKLKIGTRELKHLYLFFPLI
jgi:hypothetical protein